jgi:outer membrane protein assembly factor BamB
MKILSISRFAGVSLAPRRPKIALTNKPSQLTAGGFLLLAAAAITPTTNAGDWPQLLGPNRNGVAQGEQLLDSWPDGGPTRLWTKPLGTGYAGVAIQGDRVVSFHRVGGSERVEAFTVGGELAWKQDFSANYRGGANPDDGPRCTPVIDGDQVLAFGAAADLYCVSLADGATRWIRNLSEDYSLPQSYFGVGSSPIVIGDRVLINLGARGAGLIALDRKTGETVWKQTDENASYSSPIAIQLNNNTNVLFITRYNAVCVQPKDGKEVFRFKFGKRGPTVNAATPLFHDGVLFLTASYGIGAQAHQIKEGAVAQVWADDRTLSSQYATAVLSDGYLFGCHGREDIGVAAFRCVDARTGEVKWSQDDFGVAHVIQAGPRLLIQTTDGRLELAKVNTTRFERIAHSQVAEGSTRAVPALADGRLFIRQNNGKQGALICLQVGKINRQRKR